MEGGGYAVASHRSADIDGFVYILWIFVLCIGALFCMPRGWRGGAAPPGAVVDVNNFTQALMITILPVYV